MLAVRFGLPVFVTVRATEYREIPRVRVAFTARTPLGAMCAGINREQRRVIECRTPIGGRMTVLARRRVLIRLVVRIC